MQKYKNSGVGR